MIVMPRRSVTRFFIPMIDVLTLLFCIFLLMPFVKATGEGEDAAGAATPKPPETVASDPKDLAAQVDQLQREVDRLKQERSEVVQQLTIRTLEIDKDSGGLFYYAGDRREPIRGQEDAIRLIEQDRRDVRRKGGRELYYLLLYPRVGSGFPTERQVNDYERWFQGVAHGYDNPRAQN